MTPASSTPDAREPRALLVESALPDGGQPDAALALVEEEIPARLQSPGHGQRLLIDFALWSPARWSRNDQRRPGFVYEHAVGLIDDCVVQATMEKPTRARAGAGQAFDGQLDSAGSPGQDDSIPQVVERDFLVGAVGHVTAIGGAAFFRVDAMDDESYGQAEGFVYGSHPLRVSPGKIVVHRDDVHRNARKGGRTSRQGRRQRFALPGLHLGDHPPQHHLPTHELDVKMRLAELTPRCFTDERKRARDSLRAETLAAQRHPKLVGH